MSKKAVKKSAVKKKSPVKKAKSAKATGKAQKTSSLKAKLPKKTKKAVPAKKSSAASKTKIKKSEKELETRAANVIANSEKKKRKPLTKLKGGKAKSERPERQLTLEEASALTKAVVEGMRDRKAKNIAILDLKNIENRVCDTFVICDADSKTHVMSIAESVEEMVFKLAGEKPYKSEGQENSEWILVDYVNVVAHVFLRETREHYNIEGLWGDAKFTLINN
jgi:ribosome-associated protein